ncbi:MAG: hypothetical protein OEZ24_04245 [Candidatus Bathyarchaeota archaeon]|nr:hypothetical protein [Candidatus Bathyarchaeota archaeon]
MSEEETGLELLVRYKGMEVRFRGEPDEVIRSFLSFVSKVLPAYDLVSGLTLTVDLGELLKSIEGLIAFTPEGPVVTVPREKIGGERDTILLHLIKNYVGYETGRTEKPYLTTSEIASLTGGKSSTVAARLSELTSLGWVERIGRGEYRVTTLGAKSFLDEILPRIKPEEGL